LQRIEAYEEMGWQYVDCFGREFEIFYCDDPDVPELFTDGISYAWAWEEQLMRAWHGIWMLLMIPLLFVIVPWFAAGSLLEMLLLLNGFLLLCTFVLYPALVVLCVRRMRLLHGLRKQFKAGVVPQQSRDWRKNRRWWRLTVVLYVIFWLAFNFRMVESSVLKANGEKIVYIAAESLTEGSDVDWEFDFGRYTSRHTLLNPQRVERTQKGGEGRYITGTGDSLAAEGLAKALYREREKRFLKDHPNTAQSTVRGEVFDEGIFLSNGGEHLLLLRSDKLVYSLQANVPLHLENCMALLTRRAEKGELFGVIGGVK